ncbi:MAG: aryl-sulfate sulfotransferase [Saprospiraceae bacterium]|nr:aryl-sulfate sulfotransferase [Saprospiraceae bacterium]
MLLQKFYVSLICILLLFKITHAQKWGYVTMIAPSGSTAITLLDTNSRVVKTITGLSGVTGYSSHMVPGGSIWRTVGTNNSTFRGGGIHGRIQKIDYNGKLLFDYTISNGQQCAHHDICPMPNGNVLVIVYELKTATETMAKGGPNSIRYNEKLLELKPTGLNTAEIVWEWNLWDHLCQTTNPSLSNYVSSALSNPHLLNINYLNTRTDWVHMNGVDYNEELDQIVLSSHFLNEMWVIDHSLSKEETRNNSGGKYGVGGGFIYRWGNPAAYGASGNTIFKVMHDAHWVPKGRPRAGMLAGVNNQGVSNNQTAIDYFQPSWDGEKYTKNGNNAYPPSTYSFRHAALGYTSNMGSAQELPNGNILVCLAIAARVYEVDSTGKQLWNYQGMMPIPQAFRYSKCFIENPTVQITASSQLIEPGESVQLSSTVGSTGSTGIIYSWSPAEGLSDPNIANPIATPQKTTKYQLTISSAEGCTASSEVTIRVNVMGAIDLELSAEDDQICLGQITQLFAEANGGSGNYTYEWSSNPAGFNSNQADPYINPEENTWFYVSVNDGTETATDSIWIEVLPLPDQPSIRKEDSLLISSASMGNRWFFYGNIIEGAMDSSYHPTEHGSYQVQVVDSNGCASFLSEPYEYFPNGNRNITAGFDWSIVPNPVMESFRIVSSQLLLDKQINIIDLTGRVYFKGNASGIVHTLDWPSGTYLVGLVSAQKAVEYRRIIINH